MATPLSGYALTKWVMAFVVAQWLAVPPTSRTALVTLLIFMGIDLITGLWSAWIQGSVTSEIGSRGISSKLGTIVLLMVCHLLENRVLHTELNLEMAGALGYTVNEVISIVENLSHITNVPNFLVDALMKVKHLRPTAATPEQLHKLEEEGK